jgi:enolase
MAEARIERIVGRRVWGSRGRPTVEAEIFLDSGATGRAIASAGASIETHEAVELRDGGRAFGGYGVEGAVANVDRSSKALLDPLLKLPNAVVTPHLAWLTGETLERSLVVSAEKCRRLRVGEALAPPGRLTAQSTAPPPLARLTAG